MRPILARLDRFLGLPEPAAADDPPWAGLRAGLGLLALAGVLGGLLASPNAAWRWPALFLAGLTPFGAAGLWALAKRGRFGLASALTVAGLWLLPAGAAAIGGRPAAFALAGHLVPIVLAAGVLGRRAAAGVWAASTVVGLGLAAVQAGGSDWPAWVAAAAWPAGGLLLGLGLFPRRLGAAPAVPASSAGGPAVGEALYRRAIEAAEAVPYHVDYAAGVYRFLGSRIEEITGYAPAELTPARFDQIVEEVVRLPAAGGASANPLTELRSDKRIRTRSGETRWLADTAVELGGSVGAAAGAIGILQDITERKQIELALRQAEQHLRTVIQTIPVVLYTLDRDGVFTLSEGRGLASLGLQPGQVVGLSAFDLYRDNPDILVALRQALAGEPAAVMIHTAGRAFDMRCDPLRDAAGAVAGMLGVALDVTAHEAAVAALRESERRFRAVVEKSAEAVALLDRDGRVLYDSPSAAGLLGFATAELVHRHLVDLIHPADRGPQLRWLQAAADQPGASLTSQFRHQHANGGWRWIEATATNLLDEPAVQALVVNYRDITERRQAEEALRASEERYMLAARGANDGLWDWDLRSGAAYYSPRWLAMLGLDEQAPAATPDAWFERVHPEDLERLRLELAAHLQGAAPHFESECRLRHADGSYRWMLSRGLAVRDAAGAAVRIAGSLTDITARKRAEAQLLHDALHDALTGLPNRALLMDRLGQALRTSYRREAFFFGVLFLDLDGFKVVNDSLGHGTGDQLLLAIAERLGTQMRAADTLARLGGDEFVILLEDIQSPADAVQVAERILTLLGRAFELRGLEVVTSASVGVVWSGVGYERPEDILRDADIAMYRAKALGKARYEVFNPYMREVAVARLETEADLRRAVEREEFEIHYQPIVTLATGELAGFEALLRWAHPRRGLLAPGAFIPLAEESGLIVALDLWTLAAACRQLREWQTRFAQPLTLNVNLSGRHFTRPDLVPQIGEVLAATGFPAECLRLEITEGVIMDNMAMAQRALRDLHQLGIRVEIDDFGTGYSSLGYLYQLPVDTLKIDRSFVAQLDPASSGRAIVSTIVNLAHNLNMSVIAEGIETAGQLAQLRALGCEQGQGFWIARPLPGAAAADLIASWETLRPDRLADPAAADQLSLKHATA